MTTGETLICPHCAHEYADPLGVMTEFAESLGVQEDEVIDESDLFSDTECERCRKPFRYSAEAIMQFKAWVPKTKLEVIK